MEARDVRTNLGWKHPSAALACIRGYGAGRAFGNWPVHMAHALVRKKNSAHGEGIAMMTTEEYKEWCEVHGEWPPEQEILARLPAENRVLRAKVNQLRAENQRLREHVTKNLRQGENLENGWIINR
jgi:hypothetical protein